MRGCKGRWRASAYTRGRAAARKARSATRPLKQNPSAQASLQSVSCLCGGSSCLCGFAFRRRADAAGRGLILQDSKLCAGEMPRLAGYSSGTGVCARGGGRRGANTLLRKPIGLVMFSAGRTLGLKCGSRTAASLDSLHGSHSVSTFCAGSKVRTCSVVQSVSVLSTASPPIRLVVSFHVSRIRLYCSSLMPSGRLFIYTPVGSTR